MAEREYYDLEDWARSGADPTYGQGASDTGDIYGAPPPASTPRGWQYDPSTLPTTTPPPGTFWIWEGDHWGTRPLPGDMSPNAGDPNRSAEDLARAQPGAGGGVGGGYPTTYGGGGGGGGGQFDYGRAPGGLGFSPYREMPGFNFSPFSYGEFKGSNWDDALKEPGFEKSQERLAKMIQNTAAYRGVLRSGATIGDIGTYLDQNQGQNFQQFDTRNFRNWSANRDNAADAWSRNMGAEQFSYGQRATDNQNFNNYRFNTEKAGFDDMLTRWQELVRSTTSLASPPG